MSDLLEDPDGAPYPEEVQVLVRNLGVVQEASGLDDLVEFVGLVEALEAVRGAALEADAREYSLHWHDGLRTPICGGSDPLLARYPTPTATLQVRRVGDWEDVDG